MNVIESIKAEKGKRILAVSDIHGNGRCLKILLEKSRFSNDDMLIIIGDIIDKGRESLKTLRYVMELNERENVFVTMGNVEFGRLKLLEDDSEEGCERLAHFILKMDKVWGGSLFGDMLKEMSIDIKNVSAENISEYREIIIKKYNNEINFMKTRPIILEAGNYIFVHGGIPTDNLSRLSKENISEYLKNDRFFEKDYSFSKYVVVGHYPSSLYEPLGDNSPIIDNNKRIITIDGGCGIKKEGQLNLLIIPDAFSKSSDITWIFEDGNQKVKILENQEGKAAKASIVWPDTEIEIISADEDTSLIRHKSSNKEMLVANTYIYGVDNCEDTNDSRADVQAGEIVSVIAETKKGIIINNNGKTGWYFGEYENVQ